MGGSLPCHAYSGCKDAVLEGVGKALFRALSLVSRDASKKRENLLQAQPASTIPGQPVKPLATPHLTQYGHFKSHRQIKQVLLGPKKR